MAKTFKPVGLKSRKKKKKKKKKKKIKNERRWKITLRKIGVSWFLTVLSRPDLELYNGFALA